MIANWVHWVHIDLDPIITKAALSKGKSNIKVKYIKIHVVG